MDILPLFFEIDKFCRSGESVCLLTDSSIAIGNGDVIFGSDDRSGLRRKTNPTGKKTAPKTVFWCNFI